MRILMLDPDPHFISVIARTLQPKGIEVVAAETMERAHHVLAQHRFDVAVLDSDVFDPRELRGSDGLGMVLTTSTLPEGARGAPLRALILCKPFTRAQLLSVLHEACGGTAPEDSTTLVDMLQLAHDARQTLALRVGGAELFMEQGELLHATFGAFVGEAALVELLSDRQSECLPIRARSTQRSIRRPFQTVMLDALHVLEAREACPDDDSDQRCPEEEDRS